MDKVSQKAINAIRYIGLKSIQEAKGGHIGMAISAAPITYTLYTKIMNINVENGKYINRDRFVLSGGHGSMCLYPILYLSGLLNKEEMLNFKKENSKTPGHPEFEKEKNNFIDASTGPLGQGFAMGVGMALAQKHTYNIVKEQFPLMFNNYTYIVCGDGDLQEGVSYEAMAIAGKYNLDKLIVLHDSNKFQLDSSVETVSVENLRLRAESNNWFYLKISNNPLEIEEAINKAKKSGKPSFIEVETTIAEGLGVANSNKGHHGVITNEELEKFNKYYKTNFKDWNIDQDIIDHFKKQVIERSLEFKNSQESIMMEYMKNPKFREVLLNFSNEQDYQNIFKKVKISNPNQATRVYLKEFLSSLDKEAPFTVATCADVASSTNIKIGNNTILENGQNIPIGIREFAMGAIMNGMSLYGIKPIGGTFLVFADYIKSAIRLGAMMKLPVVYAFTHDTYKVGGDGPTHQPFDQLPMLRSIENVVVHRPADEEELREALIESYSSKSKTNILILSRQNLKSINLENRHIEKGAYEVNDIKDPDYVIAAAGSEVELALEVSKVLPKTRVISVPCLQKAIKLNKEEKIKLFGAKKALLTLEASADMMWLSLHLTNQKNYHLGANSFGKSMDGDVLYKNKGFNVENIVEKITKAD